MRSFAVAVIIVPLAFPGVARAQSAAAPAVGEAVRNDVSPPLREIVDRLGPIIPQRDREVPNQLKLPFPLPAAAELERDPLLSTSKAAVAPAVPTPGPSLSFEGTSDDDNAAVLGVRIVPPDTNGDVGIDHYVQENNLVLEVFDKATGASILGPAPGNAPWAGFGGICESNNDGDPTVLYDHLADRWVFSQFANPPAANEGHQCFAISTTPDPTGPYYRYDFLVSPGAFNDYPKLGVWPDAYYLSINEFGPGPGIFQGPRVVALERAQMLDGGPAQMVTFSLSLFSLAFSLQPSHLEGPPPPAGTPNTFVTQGALGGYRLWDFSVNWTNPAASSFVELPAVPSAAFDVSVATVPQPAPGEPLDAVADFFMMYRAQHRRFDTHRSIVVNHTVDVGGNRAGVRWVELRNAGAGWTLHQEGTHAPADGLHRWMGSAAQDRNGNLALGYSTTGTALVPEIRYATRSAADPLGTLPGGEVTLHAGGGVQVASFGRWGDYSSMSTDPFPDCTFWYTQQYYANDGNFDFKTRVGSFAFPSCGPSVLLSLNADAGEVVSVPPASIELTLDAAAGGSVTPMDWYFAAVVEGTVFWFTGGGVSTTPGPIATGLPPADVSDLVLWDLPLPSGTSATFVLLLLDGSSVAAFDYITAAVS